MRALLLTLIAGAGALHPGSPRAQEPQDATAAGSPPAVELLHLANEGFLIRAGEDAVLIDGFLERPYVGYAALSADALELLAAAEAPFDSIDMALASHVHADHFQAGPACAFLNASPETLFASSEDVVAALGKECAPLAADSARVRTVLPQPGEAELLRQGELSVEVLRLSHGTGRFAGIQNLGHLLTIGGLRLLHVGDAAMDPAHFAPYDLASRELDVALVPYWYFQSGPGRRIVREHFHADTLVACHIPPAELDAVVAHLALEFPEVIVFRESLEARRIERASPAADAR